MRKLYILISLFMILTGAFSTARAQADIGIKENLAGGEVASTSEVNIVLQTTDGEIEAVLSGSTIFKRIPPEDPTLKAAVESSFSEIGIGDKILVTGLVSKDKKTIPAKTVYLITKSDIAQRQAKESQEWKTRGIAGKVVSVDPLSKEITISTRGLIGETKTVITPKDDVKYHRYVQDSVKFSEARVSALGEISPGDMIRALGDKGEGSTFKAEIVVTGGFQTTAGTVTAVDVEKNELTVNDIQTKKPVTIIVGKTSILKEFPAEMAQRMAMMQAMPAGAARPPQSGDRPPQAQGNSGQPGGARAAGGGSIDDMLERFPNITVGDLKIGDTIAVSSSKTGSSDRITAIKLLSGVEPFLRASQAGAGRSGRRSGQDSGFNIPGLDDGFGIP